MTSGGDAPGMNAVVRAVARMAMARGCEPYAIREGYEGLVRGGKSIQKISWEDVRGHLSQALVETIVTNNREERLLALLDALHFARDLGVCSQLNISLQRALML